MKNNIFEILVKYQIKAPKAPGTTMSEKSFFCSGVPAIKTGFNAIPNPPLSISLFQFL